MDSGDDVGEPRTAGEAFSVAKSSNCLFEKGVRGPPSLHDHVAGHTETHIPQRLTAIPRPFSFPLLSLLSFGSMSLC